MNVTTQPVAAHARTAVYFTAALAALAGLMFGLDVGVISGAQQFIQHDFAIDDRAIEHIVSSMMLGAAIGAALAAWLSGHFGRKRSLIFSATLFVIGSVLSAAAWSPDSLIVARLVLGLAIGVAAFTAPLYLAEIAPEDKRGAMISTYQLMITIGIFLAFLSDTAFSYSESWRWMLGIIALPGALFLLGVLSLPESPRWLLMRGRGDEARAVLGKLRGDDAAVARDVADIEQQLRTPQQGWQLFLDLAHLALYLRRIAAQLVEHRARIVVAAAQHQPARAFRQHQHAQQEQRAGQGDDAQHPAPGFDVAEGGVGKKGHEDADGDHQLVGRDHRAALVLRRDLGQIQRRGEGGDADRQPQHQTRHDQHLGRSGCGAAQRAEHEQRGAEYQRALAAEVHRQPSGQCGTCGSAPGHRADDVLDGAVVNVELALDELLRAGNDADIEAEHQPGQRRQQRNEGDVAARGRATGACCIVHGFPLAVRRAWRRQVGGLLIAEARPAA